jgi:hypothetical protein
VVHLKRQNIFTSITFLFEWCPKNKQPIFGYKIFLGLNQLALMNHDSNQNQLTTMSSHLDKING